MTYKFNLDQETRDAKLHFPDAYGNDRWMGGIRHYKGLDVGDLMWLIDNGFADPEECQNNAPAIGDMEEFLTAHPEFRAHGYAVDKSRADYRLSIEGVEYFGVVTLKQIFEFIEMFRHADELTVTEQELSCWYD